MKKPTLVLKSSLVSQNGILNPPESNREYSSIFDNDKKGSGHGQSSLDSKQAWCPAYPPNAKQVSIYLNIPKLLHLLSL